jgi:hypothetical protein
LWTAFDCRQALERIWVVRINADNRVWPATSH